MKFPLLLTAAILAVLGASPLQAALIPFDLQGTAGFGLRAGNENPAVGGTPGSGGEIGAGITFDDVANQLTLNIGWGTANGFINLTGNTTGGHIHGPTTSGGVASFTQSAGVLFALDGLPGWNTSASAGGFSGTLTLTAAQKTELLAGRYYFNVHTATNGGGEIRGNLVAVPEPGVAGLLCIGALGLLRRQRRRL